jgi:hypothetical protein
MQRLAETFSSAGRVWSAIYLHAGKLQSPSAVEPASKGLARDFSRAPRRGRITLLLLFKERVLGQKSPLATPKTPHALAKTSSAPFPIPPALEKRERPRGTKLKISAERLPSRHLLELSRILFLLGRMGDRSNQQASEGRNERTATAMSLISTLFV